MIVIYIPPVGFMMVLCKKLLPGSWQFGDEVATRVFVLRVVPHPVKPISDSDRIGYRDIPTELLWPHMAQVSSLGPGPFVRESTEAI